MRRIWDVIVRCWVLGTTTVYTLLVFPPILCAALFSRRGRAPFFFGRLWSRMVLMTNRIRVVPIGADRLDPEHSYVFIANHASHLDSTAIAVGLPHTVRFVGKQSLSHIPIFGRATRRIGVIYIDRSNPERARQTLSAAADSLTGGISALFYAEGTRSPDGRLQRFKKGGVMLAIQTGLPIVPITVVGSHALMPKHDIRIRPGTIRVVVGAPIDTTGLTAARRDALLETVRTRIQLALDRYGPNRRPTLSGAPAASTPGDPTVAH